MENNLGKGSQRSKLSNRAMLEDASAGKAGERAERSRGTAVQKDPGEAVGERLT